jgi:hypothetical protein
MRVKELVPRQAIYHAAHQCEGDVLIMGTENPHWLRKRREDCIRKGWDPNKCARGATVEIDGKRLCRQHAGSIAIDELVKLSRAQHFDN